METETTSMENSNSLPDENGTQADFIKKELNFDVDPDDPYTKAALSNHEKDEWLDLLGSGALKKRVIKPGRDNSRPNRSDICVISYIGRLEDGTIVDESDNLSIQLGMVDVIQGLDLAIALMDTEEEAEVFVQSRFAYGTLGRKTPSPEIPPDTDITYSVVLKEVKMEPEIEGLSHAERRKIGNQKRERGNWWFSRDDYTNAIHCYRKALEYLAPANESDLSDERKAEEQVSNSELQATLEDSIKVHNNLAQAQMKCEAYDAALQSVENVLRCQPLNVKALFRKGKIFAFKGEHAKACAVLTQASKIEPENKAIQQELTVLTKKKVQDANHEKKLYQKMLGTTADKKFNAKNAKMDKGVSKKITWSFLGGTIFAVVGIIAYKFIS